MTVAVLFPTVSFHYESKTFVGAEERAECAEVVEQGKCIYIYIYISVCLDGLDVLWGGNTDFTLLCLYTGSGLGYLYKKKEYHAGGFHVAFVSYGYRWQIRALGWRCVCLHIPYHGVNEREVERLGGVCYLYMVDTA